MKRGTVEAYQRAFARGDTTPAEVAERFVSLEPVGGPLDSFITVDPDAVLSEAAASTERLRGGNPLGPLEGVLVGLKDVFDVRGYLTRGGTSFLAVQAEYDELLVSRLRAAGAVIAGKQRTTELGLSPVGLNASDGSPRNPHDPSRPTGGSSSGAGASVAGGLVPLAIGTDGGGSTRIPPALCGVYGYKPTFGRIPRVIPALGNAPAPRSPLGWWSLDQPGPIARCVADLATAYTIMAEGPPLTLRRRRPPRVGVDWEWWGEPDAAVDKVCRAAIADLGVSSVRIHDLNLVGVAEYVTVIAEVAAAMWEHLQERPDRFGADVQVTLQAATALSAVDYVRAQQARTVIARSFASVFERVDLLVTPTTACTAPAVDPQAWAAPFLDESLVARLTAYTFPANLAGLPAVTLPVGTDDDGLPIGLQLVGAHGQDRLVLEAAAQLERAGVVTVPSPRLWQSPLEPMPIAHSH